MNNRFKNLFDDPTLEETNILIDKSIDAQTKIDKKLEKKLQKNVLKMIGQDRRKTLFPVTRILKVTAAACFICLVVYIISLPVFKPQDDFYISKNTDPHLSASSTSINSKNIIESELNPDAVAVMSGGYTTLSSMTPGLLIEVFYSGTSIDIYSETGQLLTWNSPSGSVENRGDNYTLNDSGKIYWSPLIPDENYNSEPDISYVTIKIRQDGHIIGAAVINITNKQSYYYAKIIYSAGFPQVDGKYQDIGDEDFNQLVNRVKKEYRPDTLTSEQKNALIEFIGIHYDTNNEPIDIIVLGKVDDYLICFYNNAADTAIVNVIMGGYKFFNPAIGYPSALCVYAVGKDNDVYTLQQAYVNSKIDIGKAYLLIPEYIKKGTTNESDVLYNEYFGE